MKNGTLAAIVLGLLLSVVIIKNFDPEQVEKAFEGSKLLGDTPDLYEDEMAEQFTTYISRYGKSYNHVDEHQERYSIFKKNMELINKHNKYADIHGYTLGINKFGDLSNEEYVARYLKQSTKTKPSMEETLITNSGISSDNFLKESKTEEAIKNLQIPASVDWVAKGATTPVRDMGDCVGAHWAFSAISAIEGSNFIHRQRSEQLSVQQAIDCVKGGDFKSDGCNGGHISEVFDYAKGTDLCAEEDYPFEGAKGSCNAWWNCQTDNYVKSYREIPAKSRFDLYSAIAEGPVALTIDAASDEFRFYSGGIFGSKCQEDPNHALTAVGYDVETWFLFWSNHFVHLKNSWGEDWGESGFMRISSNVEEGRGTCGIYQQAYLPLISH